jgi:hypothetical protein
MNNEDEQTDYSWGNKVYLKTSTKSVKKWNEINVGDIIGGKEVIDVQWSMRDFKRGMNADRQHCNTVTFRFTNDQGDVVETKQVFTPYNRKIKIDNR